MLKEPKQRILTILLLTAAAVVPAGLCQLSEATAGSMRDVEIIFDGRNFFFAKDDANIEIQKGGTVQWIVRAGEHRLVADSPPDAFPKTPNFTSQTKPTVKHTFKEPGEVKYHCEIHPKTMIGTIKVTGE